ALCNLNPHQLFDGHCIAKIVDERRDIVETVRVGNGLVVPALFAALLETTMEVTNLDITFLDGLAFQFRHNANDTVHRRVRRPDIQQHCPRREFLWLFEFSCHGLLSTQSIRLSPLADWLPVSSKTRRINLRMRAFFCLAVLSFTLTFAPAII